MIIRLQTNRFPVKKCALLLCALLLAALAAGCGGGGGGGAAAGSSSNNSLIHFPAVCGNSAVETTEECDDGNASTESCTYGETTCTVCSADCTYATGRTSFCGDSIIDTENNEKCDDGNTTPGDGCDDVCVEDIDVRNRIATGHNISCAITTSSEVKCWGEGFGNTAVTVSELGTGNRAASIGLNWKCFLTGARGVKCAGRNDLSQLGNGTLDDSSSYTDVSGLTGGVIQISTGDGHSCALLDDGTIKCWGGGISGQLGNGFQYTYPPSKEPVDVVNLSGDVVAVASGMSHSCAVMKTGTVKCWGDNLFEQLGVDTVGNSNEPIDVPGLESIVGIDAGYSHTCAVTSSGGVKCWGNNASGQIGNGVTAAANYPPTDVTGLISGIVSVTTGENHTCVITNEGGVKCWGAGQGSNSPVDITGLESGVQYISAGYDHTCAMTSNETVKCWGSNSQGALGDGTTVDSSVPVTVLSF